MPQRRKFSSSSSLDSFSAEQGGAGSLLAGGDTPWQIQCRSLLFLTGACVCALLLGLHLGQNQSFLADAPRLLRLQGAISVPRNQTASGAGGADAAGSGSKAPSALRNVPSSGAGGRPASRADGTAADSSSGAPGPPANSHSLVCNEFPLQKRYQGAMHYNPAAGMPAVLSVLCAPMPLVAQFGTSEHAC